MCTDLLTGRTRRPFGFSLIEVMLFIVIVSVGVVGLMSMLNTSMLRSADPMLRKQALAVAEALLEEVEAMPFTDCDPDFYDPSTGTCTLVEAMGSEPGEVRGALATPFDNVNDYNGFTLAGGGTDIGGVVSVPAGYSATVAVAQDAAFGATGAFLPAADVLRISVTVSYNGGSDSITLAGYRTRYAPNDMP
jgi:MSHA pilin protein MshD